MSVECNEETISLGDDFVHVNTWLDSERPVLGVVLLVHGLMMHGRSFDELAKRLVGNGIMVVAPDLRGFGRWYFRQGKRSTIDYEASLDDVGNLSRHLKAQYDVPLVIAGESLGAHVARALAAANPGLYSGLILSNPCIRPRMVSLSLIPHAVSEAVQIGLLKYREVDLKPFAGRFLKDEPERLKEYLEDPMSRKSLDVLELIESMLVVGSFQPARLPAHMPVLVFRGENDGVCQSASYNQFISTLKTDKLTYHRCGSCAHIILQSRTIEQSIVAVLLDWLAGI